MYESAVAKVHFEYFGSGRRILRHGHDPSALFVFAMALHVQNPVESALGNVDFHLYTVRQTSDDHFRSREVRSELRRVFCELFCEFNLTERIEQSVIWSDYFPTLTES